MLITVLRGSITDDYQDETDQLVAVYTRVPAEIRQTTRSVRRDERWMTVTGYELEVTAKYTLAVSDVITDSKGRRFVVDDTYIEYGLAAPMVHASCTQVTI